MWVGWPVVLVWPWRVLHHGKSSLSEPPGRLVILQWSLAWRSHPHVFRCDAVYEPRPGTRGPPPCALSPTRSLLPSGSGTASVGSGFARGHRSLLENKTSDHAH